MYPALKKNVVIVKGYGASGIYDLNNGVFERVSHDAGDFLSQALNGLRPINEFDIEEQAFISEAHTQGLVEYHNISTKIISTQLAEVLRSSRPIRFAWIEIASICNQKCLHCFLGDELNKFNHMPLDKIKKNIDALVEEGVRQIVFSGGEPTLHPNIVEILDYAGKTNVNISLLTNGSSIKNASLIEAILRNDVVVKIPILGWRDSHEKMTRVRGSFRKTIATVIGYAKSGIRLQLGTTVTSVNASNIKKIVSFANFLGLPIEVSPIYKIGYAQKNSEVLFQHTMRELINFCKVNVKSRRPRYKQKEKRRDTIPKQVTDYESVDIHNFLTDTHECGQKIIAILASGEVTPCLMIRSKSVSMGNANRDSLTSILKGPTRADFHRKMKIDGILDCKGCEARYVCKAGGCPATALAFKGTINEKNPLYSNCYYVNPDTVDELKKLNLNQEENSI